MSRCAARPPGLLAALVLVAALAAANAQAKPPVPDADTVSDPWEGMNRGIFAFNEGFDGWIFEPVAKGWDFVMPDPVQTGIHNFFTNLGFPVVFLNNVLQAKPEGAVTSLGRFLINTTVGVAGFFDPATWLRMPESDEDFGQTLGYWGVPGGPFLVLPILGPSNPRDTVGLVVDRASLTYTYFVPWYANIGATLVERVNWRARHLETIREERKSAFDFYVAVRNAYVQRRDNQIADRQPKSEESDDDLYEVDPIEDPQ